MADDQSDSCVVSSTLPVLVSTVRVSRASVPDRGCKARRPGFAGNTVSYTPPADPFPRRTISATTTRSRQPASRLPLRPSPSTTSRAAGLPRWRRLRPGIERYPAPRRASQCSKKRAFTPKNDVAGPCNVVFSSNNVVARRKTTMSGLTTQLFDRTTTMFSLTTLFHAEKHQCLC